MLLLAGAPAKGTTPERLAHAARLLASRAPAQRARLLAGRSDISKRDRNMAPMGLQRQTWEAALDRVALAQHLLDVTLRLRLSLKCA